MIILGVDPGSLRTGYGAIETDGRRHRLLDLYLYPWGSLRLPGDGDLFDAAEHPVDRPHRHPDVGRVLCAAAIGKLRRLNVQE